jgi:hypothetical protein
MVTHINKITHADNNFFIYSSFVNLQSFDCLLPVRQNERQKSSRFFEGGL